jgi:hypothetical protein
VGRAVSSLKNKPGLRLTASGAALAILICVAPPVIYHYGRYQHRLGEIAATTPGASAPARPQQRRVAPSAVPLYADWDFWVAITTLALVFPAWLTIVYARRTSERQLRAYVNIVSARITYNDELDIWESRIEQRNVGQTPAYDVRIFGVLELAEWPLDESKLKPINDEDADASRYVLGPNSGRTKIDRPYNLGLFKLSFKKLRRGTWDEPSRQMLVAHGSIFFRDVFGHRRRTDYRYYVGGKEGLNDSVPSAWAIRNEPRDGDLTFRMVAHSNGNDAT